MSNLRLDRPFVANNVADVVVASKNTGIFPSVKLAQAILETGFGKSSHARADVNNLYGIKGNSAWKGRVVSSTTQEVINGVRQTFQGTGKIYPNRDEALKQGAHSQTIFRVYDTYFDSHLDHIKFLQENPRYTKNGVFAAKTPQEQSLALQRAGYGSATEYASKLNTIIRDNGLEELDKMMNNPSVYKDLASIVQKKKAALTQEPEAKPTQQWQGAQSSDLQFSDLHSEISLEKETKNNPPIPKEEIPIHRTPPIVPEPSKKNKFIDLLLFAAKKIIEFKFKK